MNSGTFWCRTEDRVQPPLFLLTSVPILALLCSPSRQAVQTSVVAFATMETTYWRV